MTPGTNKKVGEALKLTYASWYEKSTQLEIPTDPREWTKEHVADWLKWTMVEFSLCQESNDNFIKEFQVHNKQKNNIKNIFF